MLLPLIFFPAFTDSTSSGQPCSFVPSISHPPLGLTSCSSFLLISLSPTAVPPAYVSQRNWAERNELLKACSSSAFAHGARPSPWPMATAHVSSQQRPPPPHRRVHTSLSYPACSCIILRFSASQWFSLELFEYIILRWGGHTPRISCLLIQEKWKNPFTIRP